jgi:hypothetical protein
MDIDAVLPDGATGVTVSGVDRSMTESSVLVTATLSAGGEQSYRVSLVRDGLGWKVDGVTVEYPALDGAEATIDTGEPAEAETTEAGSEAAGTESQDAESADAESADDGTDTTSGSL